jgi:pimeloyl-ACP methyl ester carboxylesterase
VTRPAFAFGERGVLFGRESGLLGIWTEPRGTASGVPVVLLGAGILHRIGPSRVSVHVARALARAGHPVLRFDLAGIGDSMRPTEDSLERSVRADIRDAIDEACARAPEGRWAGQVALVGFCSGADNALHAGSDDPRVRAAVLFDPTVHRTAGFHRRELREQVLTRQGWWSVLTARALRVRIAKWRARSKEPRRPPGYYGLLVAPPEETDARARRFRERGGLLRFVLSAGVQRYCNSPDQVSEALPTAAQLGPFDVVWAPQFDHVFATRAQVDWFIDGTTSWLARAFPTGDGAA